MRKTASLVVAIFIFGGLVFAQSQTPDERVKTSTVIPDLHNPASGWKIVPEREKTLYQSKDLTVKLSDECYENDKDQMTAFLSVKNTKGNREELSMLYGTDNFARGAIKSEGVWHVSRDLYFDNGIGNPRGAANWIVIYDEKEKDKPVKAKLFLETVDGPKEVTIDLQ